MLGLGGTSVEHRRVGDTLYGANYRQPVGTLHWQAVPLHGDHTSTSRSAFTLVDPQVALGVLAASRATPVTVGHEWVDGISTTHYRLATTLAAFLKSEEAPITLTRRLRNVAGVLDVWLDQQGRPVAVRTDFGASSPLGASALRSEVRFSDYGASVTVHPPAHVRVSANPRANAKGAIEDDPLLAFIRLLFAQQSR